MAVIVTHDLHSKDINCHWNLLQLFLCQWLRLVWVRGARGGPGWVLLVNSHQVRILWLWSPVANTYGVCNMKNVSLAAVFLFSYPPSPPPPFRYPSLVPPLLSPSPPPSPPSPPPRLYNLNQNGVQWNTSSTLESPNNLPSLARCLDFRGRIIHI